MTSPTPSYVILPSDVGNTGKLVDNVQVTNESAQSVQREVVTIGDAVVGSRRMSVSSSGSAAVSLIPLTSSQLVATPINSSSGGDITVVSGVSLQTARLYRLVLVAGGSTNIEFKDGSSALSGPIPLLQGGGITLDYSGDPWYATSAGNSLIINSSNAVQISGTAYYAQS